MASGPILLNLASYLYPRVYLLIPGAMAPNPIDFRMDALR